VSENLRLKINEITTELVGGWMRVKPDLMKRLCAFAVKKYKFKPQ
jgi:hypothetical protein